MECLEKPVWNNYTEEELWQIQIPELDTAAGKKELGQHCETS